MSPDPIDVARVRSDTPASANLIHFNNAGASLPPRPVVEAVKAHIDLEAAMGGYEAATHTLDLDEAFYRSAAALLGCSSEEIAFTVSASDAWWKAFSSVPLSPGDRVLTGRAEYVSNAFGLIRAQQQGVLVDVIENDEDGQIDLNLLAEQLSLGDTKLVALTHVPTSSGLVNPAAEVGALAREAGAWYLLDACQSAGQMHLDVEALQCDFLSLTGRKFLRGPRGSGLLYARSSRFSEMQTGPFIDGRSANWNSPFDLTPQPTAIRFEMFETSYAAKRGLGVAIDYALDLGLDAIQHRVRRLADATRTALEAIDGVAVHDPGRERCGIVTFTVKDLPAFDVQAHLFANGVNTSMGSAEMAQFDLGHRNIPEVGRASVHYFNTDDEIDVFVDLVASLAQEA